MKKSISKVFRTVSAVLGMLLFSTAFIACELESPLEESDFVYEVVNNTTSAVTIQNYIKDYSTSKDGSILHKSKEIALAAGEKHDFCYKMSDIISQYVTSSNRNYVYIGTYYQLDGKDKVQGWENNVYNKGRKHIVTLTESSADWGFDGTNSWDVLDDFVLSPVDSNYDFVYEIVNNSTKKLSVANYVKYATKTTSELLGITKAVVIEPGQTYQFKYNVASLTESYGSSDNYMGIFMFPEGKWECYGWESSIINSGKKHTVTVIDSEEFIDGVNNWSDL